MPINLKLFMTINKENIYFILKIEILELLTEYSTEHKILTLKKKIILSIITDNISFWFTYVTMKIK